MTDEDYEVTVGCAAVHPDQRGGQHVARSCSGVRVTHRPTGISVLCVDERSQFQNKAIAFEKLQELLAMRAQLAAQAPVIAAAEAWLDSPLNNYAVHRAQNNLFHAVRTLRAARERGGGR